MIRIALFSQAPNLQPLLAPALGKDFEVIATRDRGDLVCAHDCRQWLAGDGSFLPRDYDSAGWDAEDLKGNLHRRGVESDGAQCA